MSRRRLILTQNIGLESECCLSITVNGGKNLSLNIGHGGGGAPGLPGPPGPQGPQGDPGDPGPPGPSGDAATVDVGTTTTGAPGTDASVVNSGTTSAAVFDFTIPRGDVGAQGDPGPQGDPGDPGPPGTAATVDAGTTTTVPYGDPASVTNSGTTSAAIFDFEIPEGPQGDPGPPGDPGAPGVAATVDAGTTTTGAPGTLASVVNSGTTSAAIFDFTIPEGQKGDTGDPGAPGVGVPTGGADGEVLTKASATDYDTVWEPAPGTVVAGATGEPHGFPNRTDSVLSFTDLSRQFTIAPTGVSFDVWCSGTRYVIASPQSVTIPNLTGLYYIYFSAGTLGYGTTYFDWPTQAPTAYVYYNAATGKAEFFADERHGITLDWQTHEYLHRTRGAAFANGFSLGSYTLGGAGNVDSDAQANLTGGTFFDEDLQVDIVSTGTPTPNTWEQDLGFPMKVPVFHLAGTGWVRDTATSFPLKQGAVRPTYNLNTAGVWTTPDAANGKYVISWLIATNNLNAPVVAVLGQAEYSSLNTARNITWDSLQLPGFPVFEMRPLWKMIFLTQTAMANTPKASLADIQDLRGGSAVGAGSITSDHGLLAGLGDDDHVQYALADGSRGAFDSLGAAATVQGNLTSHEGLTTAAHGGIVPSSRQVSTGTGLTGGGDLTADRTLSVSYGTTAGTAAQGNDARLSDARTPTAHKTTHATGGTDALAPSDIGAVPTSRSVSAGTGLSGGGDLSADRTLSVSYGTTAGTATQGNDARLSDARTPTAHKTTHATGGTDALAPSDIGAAPSSRTITAGTGLTGGGDLTADRTLSVAYGTTAGTAAQGNDSRITNATQTKPIGFAGANISGGVAGGIGLIPGVNASTAVPVGSLSLGLCDRTGTLNVLGVWATATSLTAGQQIIVVAYNASATTGLPTTLSWSQAITAGTSTNFVSVTSLSLSVTAGMWLGLLNPSTNAGTITLASVNPISGGVFLAGLNRYALLASSQGTTANADVSAYTYSSAGGATVFGAQQTIPQIIARLT